MVPLAKDTISQEEIASLIQWLQTYPRLTKGDITIKFEEEWAKWVGARYAVFVNSGSSANLAAIYSLKFSKKLSRNKIIVPTVSWVTTIAPVIQFGFEPILCDSNLSNLGIDLQQFEDLCKKQNPLAAVVVHVLGFPCDIVEIKSICDKYNVILIEDCCEALGSSVNGKKVGTFGDISTTSMYYGHFTSSIEGGVIFTDNWETYNILKSIRSHGWGRDMDASIAKELRLKYDIDNFHELYTFYYPGFNIRSTDLQAFIGLEQLKRADNFAKARERNYHFYDSKIVNKFWKPNIPQENFICNLAYPIISPKIRDIVSKLQSCDIEVRPLIAGSMGRQPFWIDLYGEQRFKNADLIHDFGFYVPNYFGLELCEIEGICEVINGITL